MACINQAKKGGHSNMCTQHCSCKMKITHKLTVDFQRHSDRNTCMLQESPFAVLWGTFSKICPVITLGLTATSSENSLTVTMVTGRDGSKDLVACTTDLQHNYWQAKTLWDIVMTLWDIVMLKQIFSSISPKHLCTHSQCTMQTFVWQSLFNCCSGTQCSHEWPFIYNLSPNVLRCVLLFLSQDPECLHQPLFHLGCPVTKE